MKKTFSAIFDPTESKFYMQPMYKQHGYRPETKYLNIPEITTSILDKTKTQRNLL